MSYYSDMRTMKMEISQLIESKRGLANDERVFKISSLAILYGQRFGFGRRTIENALSDFQKSGQIFIDKDNVEVCE